MGQICHHYSWTLDYLLEYPDWAVVQRMLIDTPNYDTEDTKKTKPKEKVFDLKEQSSEDFTALMIQQFGNE